MKTALLSLLLSLPLFAQVPTTLTLDIDEAAADRAAGTIPARVTLTNVTDNVVPGITVRVSPSYPDAEVVVDDAGSWTCSVAPYLASCTRTSLAPRETVVLDLKLRFPQRAGRSYVNVNATYDTPGGPYYAGHALGTAALFRPFAVTNTDDAGAGSLRTAIEALNADTVCATLPCRIEFALPEGASHTIAPFTPLPTITAADVEVDGTQQDVELRGTFIVQGNGLYFRGPRMAVRGLAIVDFPDNGILYLPTIRGSMFTIEKNRIEANGSRGVVFEKGIVRESFIRENVITGNFRSGIFLVTAPEPGLPMTPVLSVLGNTIAGNGASGIFVGPNAQQVFIGGNTIENNAHFGIAVSPTATYVRIGPNRIAGHPLPAIDIGLDGPSQANAAELTSARYDAATDTTTITGSGVPFSGSSTYVFALYANESVDAAGYAETEQFLGTAVATTSRFTLTVKGDFRGRYISAAMTEIMNFDGVLFPRSMELLRAMRVE